MISDWDDAYANAPYIPEGAGFAARLATASSAWRARFEAERFRTVPHGPDPREIVEIFLPPETPRGVLVFVHGGYWRAFGPGDWSHLAAGALARGWAVAMPGYRLAPEARIPEMTRAIGRAVKVAAQEVAGPLVLTGHSAGGHLVARLLCDDSGLPPDVRERIARVVPISGLFDLRPFLRTRLNEILGLDLAAARSESPALREVLETVPPVHVWVGGDERPEFVRQSGLLANVWAGLGVATRLTVEPERHHFDVIDGLAEPASPLMAALLGDD
jgi:arylformamidase